MGCGSSVAAKVSDALPAPDVRKNTRKRRKNMKLLHGHLLNVLDEMVDTAKLHREYATQKRQPYADWLGWLGDEEDNSNEHRLRKAAQTCFSECEEQASNDIYLLQSYNEQISQLQGILKLLKEHDHLVAAQTKAAEALKEAKEELAKVKINHEKAKLKANYPEHRQALESAVKNKEAHVNAAEQKLVSAQATVGSSVTKTTNRKRELVQEALLHTHTSLMEYHQRSLITLRKYTEQIHVLCNHDGPLPDQREALVESTPAAPVTSLSSAQASSTGPAQAALADKSAQPAIMAAATPLAIAGPAITSNNTDGPLTSNNTDGPLALPAPVTQQPVEDSPITKRKLPPITQPTAAEAEELE